MVTVPFYPISDEILRLIIRLQLGKIKNRISDNHGAQFSYDDSVIDTVAKRCTDVDSGASNVYNISDGNDAAGNERRGLVANGKRRRDNKGPCLVSARTKNSFTI